jgi:hypothetical protein
VVGRGSTSGAGAPLRGVWTPYAPVVNTDTATRSMAALRVRARPFAFALSSWIKISTSWLIHARLAMSHLNWRMDSSRRRNCVETERSESEGDDEAITDPEGGLDDDEGWPSSRVASLFRVRDSPTNSKGNSLVEAEWVSSLLRGSSSRATAGFPSSLIQPEPSSSFIS